MTKKLPRSTSDSDIQNSLAHEPNFIYTQINERLLFTSSSMDQARSLLPPRLRKAHFIPENTSDCDIVVVEALIHPPGLASLYRFSALLSNTTRRVQDKMIVVCGGRTKRSITKAALLVGGFLILCHHQEPESVESALRPMSSAFAAFTDNIALIDCWRALAHVRYLTPRSVRMKH
jgi:hypothetical protein